MSAIESAAAPIVGPMVIGNPCILDFTAEKAVAAWVALKVMVAAHVHPTYDSIPPAHDAAVRRVRGAPPFTASVWLGYRADFTAFATEGRATLFDSHYMPLTNVDRGSTPPALDQYLANGGSLYATTFQAGRLVALSFHHDWPGLLIRPVPGTQAVQCFVPIWPAAGSVDWPPPMASDVLGDPHQVTRFFQMRPMGLAIHSS